AGCGHGEVVRGERRPDPRERRPLPRHPALPGRQQGRPATVPRLRRPRPGHRTPAGPSRLEVTFFGTRITRIRADKNRQSGKNGVVSGDRADRGEPLFFYPRLSALIRVIRVQKRTIRSLEGREGLAEGGFPAFGLPRIGALGGGAAEGFFEGVVVA